MLSSAQSLAAIKPRLPRASFAAIGTAAPGATISCYLRFPLQGVQRVERYRLVPGMRLNALDGLNFFLADVRGGLGAYVNVYLLTKAQWSQAAIGAVLSTSGLTLGSGRHPSLLTAMVFDETGERLTPTHAIKKGTRYRYYVSTSLVTGTGKKRSSRRRIPAGNLEGLVINKVRTFLADPGAILMPSAANRIAVQHKVN